MNNAVIELKQHIECTSQEEIDNFKARAPMVKCTTTNGTFNISSGGSSECFMAPVKKLKFDFYDYKTFPNDITDAFNMTKGVSLDTSMKNIPSLKHLGLVMIPSGYGYHGNIKVSMQEVVAACKLSPLYDHIRAIEWPQCYATDDTFHWMISRVFTSSEYP